MKPIVAVVAVLGWLSLAPMAHGATDPSTGAALRVAPAQLSVDTDVADGSLSLFDADHRRVTLGRAQVLAGRLTAPVPALKDGLYTAIWRAGSNSGSFAFSVGSGSPALVASPAPKDSLKPLSMIAPKWLTFSFLFVFIGTLALRVLVIGPGRPEVDRRLHAIATVALLAFIPATVWQLSDEAADAGSIGAFLTGGADGTLWLIRLVVTGLAAVVLLARRGPVFALALALGVSELLARVIPTSAPDDWARELFTQLLDFAHLLGGAIWTGGLVALALLAITRRGLEDFWARVLRRFSVLATVCVGVMILSGLWTAWIDLGPPKLLFTTLYGETLLVKLILVLILASLGAVNQFWLLPRINALDADESTLVLALRHFRGVVVAEAVVGLAVIAVVPFLSGSARNQDFQAGGDALVSRSGPLAFKPSGLVPGPADYEISAPGARRVEVTFDSPELGVPAVTTVADATGSGRFRVSGLYTTMAGDWRATVHADATSGVFAIPVAAQPPEPGRAPTPEIRDSTWIWGFAELLLVLAALVGAGTISRLLTRQRSTARIGAL